MAYGSATVRGGRLQSQSRTRQTSNTYQRDRGFQGSVVTNEAGETEVTCQHGEKAVLLTSRSEKNPNRQFYKCSRSNQDEQCKAFLWADEAEAQAAKQAATGSKLASSSQSQSASAATAAAANPRLAAAEAAEARARRLTEPSASPVRGIMGRSSQARGPTIDLDEEEYAVEPTEAEWEMIEEVVENTPPRKRPRFSFGSDAPAEDEFDSQATMSSSQDRAFAQKKPAKPQEKVSQWTKIQNDTNSPFHARSEALKTAFTPPSTPASQRVANGEVVTPSTANTDEALKLLDAIDDALGGQIPSVATIRRALLAEQRKAKAATQQKDTLISLKDQECQRLQAENDSLRSRLDATQTD